MPRKSAGPRLVRRKGKKNWYIRYIDEATGKQKDLSTGFEDCDEAEEQLEEILRERRAYRHGHAVSPYQITVAQILDDYAHFKMGDDSAERLSYSIVHILGSWQDDMLDCVNVETVKQYVKTADRKPSTVRRELADLRSAVNHAIRMNRVTPISFPKLPKAGKPKDRWLTESEFAKLLCAAGKDFRSKFTLRLFLLIGFYTGARKSAIMELEWSQVDFENNVIDFNKDGVAETNKRRAITPMAPELRRFLLRRFRRYSNQSSFLFHQKKNPSKRIKHIEKGFRAAVKRAELKNIVPHTLRHTRVSLMVQSGEKIQDVSAFMNMTYQTLEKVYAHFDKERLQEMAMRIGRSQKGRTTKNKDQQNKGKLGKPDKTLKGEIQ